MGKEIDFTKPPKFILDIFSFFRKWKLSNYKRKKIRQEKSPIERYYFLKFKIKISDSVNPQESEVEYEMVVPAKAVYFAKKKTEHAIREKLNLQFTDMDILTDKEYQEFENSKEDYVRNLN